MTMEEILSHCDHTLLRQQATRQEIIELCNQAIRFGCASVCIPPCHVYGAKQYVAERMRVCTVVGFPNGYSTTRVKAYEARSAVAEGADEIDMVCNLAMIRDACWDDVYRDIAAVRQATEGKILKVIIETCLLTQPEKEMACAVVSASGAEYIKTSTGFSTGGATAEDVALLRRCCQPHVKIKAAGGIGSWEDAERFLELGADRLGTSRLVKLALEAQDKLCGAPEAEQIPPQEP